MSNITEDSCSAGAVRLGGEQYFNGYANGEVQICYNGNWGTVCKDQWTNTNNARVTCRQLGHSANGAIAFPSSFTDSEQTYARIWLDNVRCEGTEARLIECRANPVGTHDCNHRDDVGVQCGECMNSISISYV